MNNYLIVLTLLVSTNLTAQSYAPPANESGTTAISKDDPSISGWATGIEVVRGYLVLEDKSYEVDGTNKVTFGDPDNALGPATGNAADVVSLGDSGVAILTFTQPITNGPGFDFAVFENSFSHDYLEFAHVEVSSDGEHYVRFPSHSEVQTTVQIHGFGLTDARRINNLAGKYIGGYGTPFDLEELKDSIGINVDSITHVKLIDVVGSIGSGGTRDSYGNLINEPYTTPYETGGFDLDGVAVMNQLVNTESFELNENLIVYPNPSSGIFNLKLQNSNEHLISIKVYDVQGKLVAFENDIDSKSIHHFDLDLKNGLYSLQAITSLKTIILKIQIE